jgi:hypothetical protein
MNDTLIADARSGEHTSSDSDVGPLPLTSVGTVAIRTLWPRRPRQAEDRRAELWLDWRWGGSRIKVRRAPDSLLMDFIALSRDAEGSRIAAFASEWGPLGICEHDLPSLHSRKCRPQPQAILRGQWYIGRLFLDDAVDGTASFVGAEHEPAPDLDTEILDGTEPLLTWRSFADEMRLLLKVAAALRAGEAANAVDIDRIIRFALLRPQPGPDLTALNAKELVARRMQWWLAVAGCVPVVSWHFGARPMFSIGSQDFSKPALAAALAVQLLYSVTATGAIAQCTECGQPYMRLRKKPKAGQDNFCSGCGKRAANRRAQARRRAKDAVGGIE